MLNEDTNAKAILLLDAKVEELVRGHLKAALNDPTFLSELNPYGLSKLLSSDITSRLPNDSFFVASMARAIGERLRHIF